MITTGTDWLLLDPESLSHKFICCYLPVTHPPHLHTLPLQGQSQGLTGLCQWRLFSRALRCGGPRSTQEPFRYCTILSSESKCWITPWAQTVRSTESVGILFRTMHLSLVLRQLRHGRRVVLYILNPVAACFTAEILHTTDYHSTGHYHFD